MTDQRDPRIREAVTRLALASPPAPTFDELTEDRAVSGVRRVPGWATAVAAAASVLAVIGGASLLLGGSDGATETPPVAQSTTVPSVSTTVAEGPVVAEGWNPILAESIAAAPPAVATCPSSADPNEAGADPAHRPGVSPMNQGAVFDTRLGRIVAIDRLGETWMFDVCTNAWIEMNADVAEWLPRTELRFDEDGILGQPTGDLVYDIDSDRTVAFGNLGAYDSDTNTWTEMPSRGYTEGRHHKQGAVYDPVSGLIIVAHQAETYGDDAAILSLSSFDVDTETWDLIGETNVHPWAFLIGYSTSTDRLIFNEPGPGHNNQTDDNAPRTWLVNPRTGATTRLDESNLDVPAPDVFAPWGTWYPYAVGVDGAVLIDSEDPRFGEGNICVFDPQALSWGTCPIDSNDGPQRDLTNAAKVYDPINERLVFILMTGDVWAVDLDTGDWTRLL